MQIHVRSHLRLIYIGVWWFKLYPKLALAFEFRKGDQKNGHTIFNMYIEGSPKYLLYSLL